MNTCLKCSKEFTPTKGLKNYCSYKCRNSKTWTEEDKLKKSISVKRSYKKVEKTKESIEKWKRTYRENYNKNLLTKDFSELKFEAIRKRILLEQKGKCNICEIDSWMGKTIILELEHKDGNNKNNSRDNLELLCPNCHSQTDTWRGRNKGKRSEVKEEDLLNALLNNELNIRQALLSIGLTGKGNNYNRSLRILEKYKSNS